MLFGADDVSYILFRRSSAMWLLAVVLIDMYVVPTLLRVLVSTLLRVLIGDYSGLLPGVAAAVAAMVALTHALLAMMMRRGVQMGLICCIFRLLGVVKCASIVFCVLVAHLLVLFVKGVMLSDTNDVAYILFRCRATRLLAVVLMNMCVVLALLSVLIGIYGGLLPGVATPVAATSTLTRASLGMMMTRDVHLSLFILQRLDDFTIISSR
ncbi:hypothetical protein Hanom_Chr06g00552521 [Helianthus anomalus]